MDSLKSNNRGSSNSAVKRKILLYLSTIIVILIILSTTYKFGYERGKYSGSKDLDQTEGGLNGKEDIATSSIHGTIDKKHNDSLIINLEDGNSQEFQLTETTRFIAQYSGSNESQTPDPALTIPGDFYKTIEELQSEGKPLPPTGTIIINYSQLKEGEPVLINYLDNDGKASAIQVSVVRNENLPGYNEVEYQNFMKQQNVSDNGEETPETP